MLQRASSRRGVAARRGASSDLAEDDGSEFFTQIPVDDGADGARFAYGVDVDGDGDIDVVAAHKSAGTIAWYEQLSSAPPALPTFEEHVVTANLDTPLDVLEASVARLVVAGKIQARVDSMHKTLRAVDGDPRMGLPTMEDR